MGMLSKECETSPNAVESLPYKVLRLHVGSSHLKTRKEILAPSQGNMKKKNVIRKANIR